jgi:hypothetical protein
VIESEAFMATMASDEGLAEMNAYVALPLEQRRAWLERRKALAHPGR